jgi:hypothetical protein
MKNDFQDSDPLEEKLIRAGGFHPDDLAFNQAGDLSPSQKRWLMLEAASWAFQAGLDLVLLAGAWIFCYYQFDLQLFIAGGLIWSLPLGISVLICSDNLQSLWADIKGNKVESASGIISKHFSFVPFGSRQPVLKMRGGYCSLEIRGHIFSVTPSVYASIVEHRTYRLFYIPNVKRLINIEPLLRSDEKKQSALAALQQRASSTARDDEE